MTEIDPALEQQILDVPQRSGNHTYITTTSRITSGEELKYRNGLGGLALDLRLMASQYQPQAPTATFV